MINITDDQKRVIEQSGHMVIEYKLWHKKMDHIGNAINSVLAYITESVKRVVSAIASALNKLDSMANDIKGVLSKLKNKNYCMLLYKKWNQKYISRAERVVYCQPLVPCIRRVRCRDNC